MDLADFARANPHKRALFHLVPISPLAKEALLHANNQRRVSRVSNERAGRPYDKTPEYGFDIGTHIGNQSKSFLTIVKLGRSLCDIILPDGTVSKLHCQFEFNRDTKVVMLRDESSSRSTKTFGDDAVSFELGRDPRRIMIAPNVNTELGIGGSKSNLYTFKLIWYQKEAQVHNLEQLLMDRMEIPEFAQTIDETATVAPSTRGTRIHATGQTDIRWTKDRPLGSGSYGDVWAAFDVDTGAQFAVKKVRNLSSNFVNLKREVQTMQRLRHVSHHRNGHSSTN